MTMGYHEGDRMNDSATAFPAASMDLPTHRYPVGAKVRVTSEWSSWYEKTGTVLEHIPDRSNFAMQHMRRPRYWVAMAVPLIDRPVPQAFGEGELELAPEPDPDQGGSD